MRRRAWPAAMLAALALGASACGGSESEARPSPAADGIETTLSDFKIKPAEVEAPLGEVTLELRNDGPSDHTFFLVRTDLADDALPVVDHVVDLDGLDVVAETGILGFEAEKSVTGDLETGAYVMFCNLSGHYESDMHAAFDVV